MSYSYESCCVCGVETIEFASFRGDSYCDEHDPVKTKRKEEWKKIDNMLATYTVKLFDAEGNVIQSMSINEKHIRSKVRAMALEDIKNKEI